VRAACVSHSTFRITGTSDLADFVVNVNRLLRDRCRNKGLCGASLAPPWRGHMDRPLPCGRHRNAWRRTAVRRFAERPPARALPWLVR
jgi:hypothetical protein